VQSNWQPQSEKTPTAAASRALIERFWDDLGRRDWDAVAQYFGPDSHYTDVCAPEEGATGVERILARLRLGIEPLTAYEPLPPKLVVADGDAVVVEHSERWTWRDGETVVLPFVSVHEVRDSTIVRWHDYWDLQTLLSAAPQWWLDHIAGGY
jgi:limonene-1,2-epoxide hydrolase